MKTKYSFRGFILLAGIFIILSTNSYAQSTIDTVWTKTYPGIYSDVGRQVITTSDGGYVIAGESESFGPGIWAAYVIKTDSAGEIIWNKTYGGGAFDFAYGIQETMDGGYILATYTTSFGPSGTNIRLLKLDASGDTVWTSLLPNSTQHTVNTAGCVLQSDDGGFLVVASGWRPPRANQIVLFKTDSAGTLEWSKDYGGSVDDYGGTIQKTSDNNFIISGYTYSYGNGQCDGYLVKVNPSGDTLWTKYYGGSSYDSFRFVRRAMNGGYIAAGTTQSYGSGEQAWVVKVDQDGSEIWSKVIGGSGNEAFEGIAVTWPLQQEIYFLSGTTSSIGSGQHDAFFVRLDTDGNILQQKAFGKTGEDFGSTIESTGTSFIALGSTENTYLDMWLIKFREDSVVTGIEDIFNSPESFYVYSNYPNPFNPSTTIRFNLPEQSFVQLKVYNVLGQEVSLLINEYKNAGIHDISFSGEGLTSGVYIYKITAGNNSIIRKMILAR